MSKTFVLAIKLDGLAPTDDIVPAVLADLLRTVASDLALTGNRQGPIVNPLDGTRVGSYQVQDSTP